MFCVSVNSVPNALEVSYKQPPETLNFDNVALSVLKISPNLKIICLPIL